MTEIPKISVFSAEESPLYSFSSRSNSPTIQHKLSTIPFEFSDNTRPGSFVSFNTPNTRLSSMSGTNEAFPRYLQDSMTQDRLLSTQSPQDLRLLSAGHSGRRQLALEIPEFKNSKSDNGIPTLVWCAFCGREVATEVCYVNSSQTFWSSVAIFLSGGVFGCFLLPYAMDSCKSMKMRCHRCKRHIDVVDG